MSTAREAGLRGPPASGAAAPPRAWPRRRSRRTGAPPRSRRRTPRRYSFRLMGIAGGLSLAGTRNAASTAGAAPSSAGVSDDGHFASSDHGHRTYSRECFPCGCCMTGMWDYTRRPFSFCDGLDLPAGFLSIWYLHLNLGIFLTDYVSYYIFHEGD